MNDICVRRYNVDSNLFKHLEIDLDLSCDSKGNLNKSIIYFLSDMFTEDEKMLYIGQTNVKPEVRIKKHMDNLKFSHIYIMQLDSNNREKVNACEQKYIKKVNPILQNILVPFENENSFGSVSYDYIVKWAVDRNKPRRPGRPKTKEECKSICVKIPVRILNDIDNLFSENKAVQLNKTQLITSLLEEYVAKNK